MNDEEVEVKTLEQQLFSQTKANVFAVLDGASIKGLREKFEQYQPEYGCLYRGELEPDLAEAAPYLVRLERGSDFVKWLLTGYGQHWGILAIAQANLRTLRKHFRSILTAQMPDGKTVLFRYYDPRVLRVYLPTCNAQENQTIFGPVLSYWVEDEKASTFLRFSP